LVEGKYAVLRVAVLYPELLGTYGDGGNALALRRRAERRGLAIEVVAVSHGDAMPDANLFIVGGGEDGPQRLAVEALRSSTFAARVNDGAQVLAVCAGLQILGHSFAVAGDASYDGLGLVDAVTVRGAARRVGDMATRVNGRLLVGFENHGGVTHRGDVPALGDVVRGYGNDGSTDGFATGSILATYAHGPVLVQNPWFCDEILARLVGHELAPLPSVADDLYAARCARLA
jgi:lipid II isoglutaminyl synthase (glutamine-hydrolysing)